MVETVSLKACRKCGCDKADTDMRRKYWFVECLHCCYHTEAADTEAEAITAWNTRASEAHTLRVAEAVRDACAAEVGSLITAVFVQNAICALDVGRIVEGVGCAD